MSLRVRVAALVAGVVVLALALAFLAAYRATSAGLGERTDEDLREDAAALRAAVLRGGGAADADAALARAAGYVEREPFRATARLLFVAAPGRPPVTNEPELLGRGPLGGRFGGPARAGGPWPPAGAGRGPAAAAATAADRGPPTSRRPGSAGGSCPARAPCDCSSRRRRPAACRCASGSARPCSRRTARARSCAAPSCQPRSSGCCWPWAAARSWRRGWARRCGGWRRSPRRSTRAISAGAWARRATAATRSPRWRAPSTTCSTACRTPSRARVPSSPTPRTSCGPR